MMLFLLDVNEGTHPIKRPPHGQNPVRFLIVVYGNEIEVLCVYLPYVQTERSKPVLSYMSYILWTKGMIRTYALLLIRWGNRA